VEIRKRRLLWIGLAVAIGMGILVMGNWFAGKPSGLGVTEGKLSPCPDSPNCVCSQETRASHRIAPLKFNDEPDAAFARLIAILEEWPRAEIVKRTENYLHVEFTTPILRFVDDAEFLLSEEESAIHMRSAARVGYSDMGKNRTRLEQIRDEFDASN